MLLGKKLKSLKKSLLIFAGFLLSLQYLSATIEYTPSSPVVGQDVTFTVTHPDGIYTPSVEWNLGDGTVITSRTEVTHAYSAAGTYNVHVTYNTVSELYMSESVSITIYEPTTTTTTTTTTTSTTTTTTSTSTTTSTTTSTSTTSTTSTSTTSTSRTTTTTTTSTTTTTTSTTTTTTLLEEKTGPRAPFTISFIQLRFEDGKSYKVVPKDFELLMAYADIKYEGTGVFVAQFLVDGNPFRLTSQSMPFADQKTIDSGNIPGLPTQILGVHEVSLKIMQPQTEYTIPPIRYFVTVEDIGIKKIDIALSKVMSLDKAEMPVVVDSIAAPAKEYFILRGTIMSENEKILPFALLRITLGDKLIDQKLIRNLEPKEDIEFETSIYNPSSERKTIYITLYNISKKPADLISIKKLYIVTREKK